MARVDLSLEQRGATDLCLDLDKRIVGVTGGAGTGKTTIMSQVWGELTNDKHSVALCAPTGRAAKRITEATGLRATTIHKLLQFPTPDEDTGESFGPARNRHNPLNEKFVIVDESSMIGPSLYQQLLDAMRPDGYLRFFGDNNQLPPVEDGVAPFVEILKRYDSAYLSFNFRSEDHIISNSLRILDGSIPKPNDRFQVIYSDDPVKEMLDMADDNVFSDDFQIITPQRKGQYGTSRINPSLQVRFNPRGPSVQLERFDEGQKTKPADLLVRRGDKFVWTRNDYELDMTNGEIGHIDDLDEHDGSLDLVMPDRPILHVPARLRKFSPAAGMKIWYDPRKQIDLGYAITTHKAQGSEFDTVVYVVTRKAPFMLNKRNFYTAVTRARSNVFVIADRRGMAWSVRGQLKRR